MFAKGDMEVRSLHGLQALSLHGSRVYGDHLGISTLTDLTSLNLTDCQWCDLKHFEHYLFCAAHLSSGFSAFGWPALQVLSVSGCNLFAAHTELEVAELQQLQVTWLKPSMHSSDLIIHNGACLPEIATYAVHPLCVEVLVDLYLSVNMSQVTPNLSESIHQLLRCCRALQVLHLISCGKYKGTATLVQGEREGQCLKELRLDSFKVDILDLSCSAMLTKLQLTEIADDDETPIMRLPDALLSFDCRGSNLFTEHARSQLLGTQLTELLFPPRAIDGRNNLSVLFLPVSLLRLHLKGETRHMNRHDWSCLEACTNLEVLTLSCHAVVSLDI